MDSSFIMQMRPWFGEEEKRAVCEYMDEDGFLTEFRRTEVFESMLSDYTGARHCVIVNNGTISITLAAMAAGVKQGDEVIVPNYTMIATPNAVQLFGAKPVFADVERDTLCLDIKSVEQAITPRTKAIILVSANGRYPRAGIEVFEALSRERGIVLIEDAAQALGSRYPDRRHIGLAGHVGSISFSAPKIISTGQGGCVLTNDDDIAARVRRLKDFGRASGGNDLHDEIGYNFKFTELQACVGIEQIKKLPWRVERKKEIYRRYRDHLIDVSGLDFFDQDLEVTTPWFIDVLVENRNGLQKHLRDAEIGTRVMYPPINKQKAYNVPGDHPVSNLVGEKGLWLPSATQLTDEDIDRVCNAIRDYYR